MKKILKKSKVLVHIVRKARKLFENKEVPESRDAFKDIRKLCKSIDLQKPIFIDGGAHNGSMILTIRDAGFVDSKIFAFEPIPSAATQIEKIGDYNVTVFTKALGDRDGVIDFNVNARAVTSSALESNLAKRYYPGLTDLSEKITVPLVKLDRSLMNCVPAEPLATSQP